MDEMPPPGRGDRASEAAPANHETDSAQDPARKPSDGDIDAAPAAESSTEDPPSSDEDYFEL